MADLFDSLGALFGFAVEYEPPVVVEELGAFGHDAFLECPAAFGPFGKADFAELGDFGGVFFVDVVEVLGGG